jgi:hypothetical protein
MLSLEEGILLTDARSEELLAVDESLDRLAKFDERQAALLSFASLEG